MKMEQTKKLEIKMMKKIMGKTIAWGKRRVTKTKKVTRMAVNLIIKRQMKEIGMSGIKQVLK